MAKITLEKLATMIKTGFDNVEVRLAAMEERFTGVNHRLDKLENNQNEMLLKMDYLAPKFEVEDLKRRVTKLENISNK